MIDDDAKAIVRTLHDALLEARGYVELESRLGNLGEGTVVGNPAAAILERVDGAIAEAAEVLS